MKKYLGWLIGIIIVLGLIIVGEVKHRMDQQKQLQQEMVKIVKSEEAHKKIEEVIRNIEPKAFTHEGVIQSFEVDYNSVKHNPMGGLFVTVIINNDRNLLISIGLQYDSLTKNLRSPSQSYTSKLDALIRDNKYE